MKKYLDILKFLEIQLRESWEINFINNLNIYLFIHLSMADKVKLIRDTEIYIFFLNIRLTDSRVFVILQ